VTPVLPFIMANGHGEDVPFGSTFAGVPIVAMPYTSKSLGAKIAQAFAAKKT